MSLVSMPFVESTADTVLHVVAGVVLFGSIAAIAYGFWKVHEIPVHEAHRKKHQQLGLISALTWVGFIWHWVWVLALIVAFTDIELGIRRLREIWKDEPQIVEEQQDA
ncbi:MFS transporter [Photobacterium gaetbulicola]|uniref:Permease of the major facilitator superfamily n=1 Tax=Photobacterium gaetbulicola Gung47 TaxID=658445 RepID=A0A0C5WMB7_9GAMM|nr:MULTISPECIES: MFS transporter [Photobacterium]AJR06209.1 hypothetical protein H744_1c1184 [Photobacterium gaetbulicola Gung47]PST98825.1 MFS transporter [Photobacterium gaetbulicola]WEM45373.1 MFS transporter [Photobacterium sp. DA100]